MRVRHVPSAPALPPNPPSPPSPRPPLASPQNMKNSVSADGISLYFKRTKDKLNNEKINKCSSENEVHFDITKNTTSDEVMPEKSHPANCEKFFLGSPKILQRHEETPKKNPRLSLYREVMEQLNHSQSNSSSLSPPVAMETVPQLCTIPPTLSPPFECPNENQPDKELLKLSESDGNNENIPNTEENNNNTFNHRVKDESDSTASPLVEEQTSSKKSVEQYGVSVDKLLEKSSHLALKQAFKIHNINNNMANILQKSRKSQYSPLYSMCSPGILFRKTNSLRGRSEFPKSCSLGRNRARRSVKLVRGEKVGMKRKVRKLV